MQERSVRRGLIAAALIAALAILVLGMPIDGEAQVCSYTLSRAQVPGRCGVALEIEADLPIWGFVATLEYDDSRLVFDGVQLAPGLMSHWTIERVNIGPYASCQPPAGKRWAIVLATDNDIAHGETGSFAALVFSFRTVGCGEYPITLPIGCEFEYPGKALLLMNANDGQTGIWSAQNAAAVNGWPFCAGYGLNNLRLYPASVHNDCTVGVEPVSWSLAKRLYQ